MYLSVSEVILNVALSCRKEENASAVKKNDSGSDSSSLPSLEEDNKTGTEGARKEKEKKKKKKRMKKEPSTRDQKVCLFIFYLCINIYFI